MIIRTELSGLGHYGVCSIIPRSAVPGLISTIQNFHEDVRQGTWENPDFDTNPWRPTGLDGSFHVLQNESENEIRLCWRPNKLRGCLHSLQLLHLTNPEVSSAADKPTLQDQILEIAVDSLDPEWGISANFGDPIWGVIEQETFEQSILPAINVEIRSWWEDLANSPQQGEYGTVFNGKDGLTLQIYQPCGDGLWISGSRGDRCSKYQLNDHNTDTALQAFAHVLSLCFVLKHCRAVLA